LGGRHCQSDSYQGIGLSANGDYQLGDIVHAMRRIAWRIDARDAPVTCDRWRVTMISTTSLEAVDLGSQSVEVSLVARLDPRLIQCFIVVPTCTSRDCVTSATLELI
jgi:hypothetical protein